MDLFFVTLSNTIFRWLINDSSCYRGGWPMLCHSCPPSSDLVMLPPFFHGVVCCGMCYLLLHLKKWFSVKGPWWCLNPSRIISQHMDCIHLLIGYIMDCIHLLIGYIMNCIHLIGYSMDYIHLIGCIFVLAWLLHEVGKLATIQCSNLSILHVWQPDLEF